MKNSIRIRAVRIFCVAVLFAFTCFASHGAEHRFTMTVTNSVAVAYDVPTLMKISTSLIDGFDYVAAGDGTHFEITDENGAILPYEIDTWNPGGESLLWVKVPVFASGKRLTVVYGRTDKDMTARASEVWSNYIGVWHMNAVNTLGKYPNSAGDARFDGEVSSFSKIGESGKFGQSVLIYTNNAHLASGIEKGGVFIPDGGNLNLAGSFTVSGWLYHTSVAGNGNEGFRYDEIFCKRQHPRTDSDLNNHSTDGFGVRIGVNAATVGKLESYGSSTTKATPSVSPSLTNAVWRHVGVAFNNETAFLWLDGVKNKSSDEVGSVTDNDEPLSLGNTSKAYHDKEGDRAWGGCMDEVRLYDGVPSDAYLAAEYAAMTGALSIDSDLCSLVIDQNEHFNDVVLVESDIPAVSEGIYHRGTTITLTADPKGTGTFRKWYGDIPREGWTNATVSFVIERDSWVYARFVHPWTLSADKTTMTDGNFTVYVSVLNEAAHTLTVGKAAEAGLSPESDTGTGTIDLGGPIWLAGDETPWTINKFGGTRGSQSFPASREGPFRYLSPGTVVTRGTPQPFHCGDSGKDAPPLFGTSYEMIILDEPSATTTLFDDYAFTAQGNVRRLIVQEPKVGELCGVRVFGSMPLTDTRFDWWDISSVSKIPEGFFEHKWGGNSERGDGSLRLRVPIMGAISLPNLRGVGWRVDTTQYDGGTLLFLMPNVEEISLGGATEETTVTNLCTYAFAGDSSLRKLTLHAAPDMTVGTRIFADKTHNTSNGVEVIDGVTYSTGTQTSRGRVPDVIHFTGQAVSEEAISNLLADVPVVSAAAKPVVIHASRFQDGWRENRRDWISNSTPAERAAYPGEKVLGVYRAGAAAPSGKAVILHRDNDWDRGMDPGLFIRLR